LLNLTGGALAMKFDRFQEIREKWRKRMANQTQRMLERNSKAPKVVINSGTSVRVPVPLVDRAKSDQRNILAVVLKANEQGTFILGTKFGILENSYTANQFDVCKEDFMDISEVSTNKTSISLREAAGLSSVGVISQGFVKCSCRKICGTKCKYVSRKKYAIRNATKNCRATIILKIDHFTINNNILYF